MWRCRLRIISSCSLLAGALFLQRQHASGVKFMPPPPPIRRQETSASSPSSNAVTPRLGIVRDADDIIVLFLKLLNAKYSSFFALDASSCRQAVLSPLPPVTFAELQEQHEFVARLVGPPAKQAGGDVTTGCTDISATSPAREKLINLLRSTHVLAVTVKPQFAGGAVIRLRPGVFEILAKVEQYLLASGIASPVGSSGGVHHRAQTIGQVSKIFTGAEKSFVLQGLSGMAHRMFLLYPHRFELSKGNMSVRLIAPVEKANTSTSSASSHLPNASADANAEDLLLDEVLNMLPSDVMIDLATVKQTFVQANPLKARLAPGLFGKLDASVAVSDTTLLVKALQKRVTASAGKKLPPPVELAITDVTNFGRRRQDDDRNLQNAKQDRSNAGGLTMSAGIGAGRYCLSGGAWKAVHTSLSSEFSSSGIDDDFAATRINHGIAEKTRTADDIVFDEHEGVHSAVSQSAARSLVEELMSLPFTIHPVAYFELLEADSLKIVTDGTMAAAKLAQLPSLGTFADVSVIKAVAKSLPRRHAATLKEALALDGDLRQLPEDGEQPLNSRWCSPDESALVEQPFRSILMSSLAVLCYPYGSSTSGPSINEGQRMLDGSGVGRGTIVAASNEFIEVSAANGTPLHLIPTAASFSSLPSTHVLLRSKTLPLPPAWLVIEIALTVRSLERSPRSDGIPTLAAVLSRLQPIARVLVRDIFDQQLGLAVSPFSSDGSSDDVHQQFFRTTNLFAIVGGSLSSAATIQLTAEGESTLMYLEHRSYGPVVEWMELALGDSSKGCSSTGEFCREAHGCVLPNSHEFGLGLAWKMYQSVVISPSWKSTW